MDVSSHGRRMPWPRVRLGVGIPASKHLSHSPLLCPGGGKEKAGSNTLNRLTLTSATWPVNLGLVAAVQLVAELVARSLQDANLGGFNFS